MAEFCNLCAMHQTQYAINLKGYYPEFKEDAINQKFWITHQDTSILVDFQNLCCTILNEKIYVKDFNDLIDVCTTELYG